MRRLHGQSSRGSSPWELSSGTIHRHVGNFMVWAAWRFCSSWLFQTYLQLLQPIRRLLICWQTWLAWAFLKGVWCALTLVQHVCMLHESASESLTTVLMALQQYVNPQLCLQTPAFLAAVLDQLQQPRSTTDAGCWIAVERYLLLVQVGSIGIICFGCKAHEC